MNSASWASFRAAAEFPDNEPDEPAEPEIIGACPNCHTHTAISDYVNLYCITCGALWSSTTGILTPEEEAAMWEHWKP